jgi:repressor of nif and glnA expression
MAYELSEEGVKEYKGPLSWRNRRIIEILEEKGKLTPKEIASILQKTYKFSINEETVRVELEFMRRLGLVKKVPYSIKE